MLRYTYRWAFERTDPSATHSPISYPIRLPLAFFTVGCQQDRELSRAQMSNRHTLCFGVNPLSFQTWPLVPRNSCLLLQRELTMGMCALHLQSLLLQFVIPHPPDVSQKYSCENPSARNCRPYLPPKPFMLYDTFLRVELNSGQTAQAYIVIAHHSFVHIESMLAEKCSVAQLTEALQMLG